MKYEVVRKWPDLDPAREDTLYCGLPKEEAELMAKWLDAVALTPLQKHVARPEKE